MPLKVDPEPVAKNPRVELADKIPPNSSRCLQESTTQVETSAHSDKLSDCTEDEGTLRSSGSSGLYQDRSNGSGYGNGADLSGSSLSTGYDQPHAFIEMSPKDMVKEYTS